jgi:CubicO group peptidase (beta-lactamase class C family)
MMRHGDTTTPRRRRKLAAIHYLHNLRKRNEKATMADQTHHRIARRFERFIEADEFAGAGLVVLKHGQPVIEHYAGYAAPGLEAEPTVLWPLASISKVYAAAAIMRLVELGELTLNTPVCQLIPAYTGADHEQVRLRHLLTHTAGMIYESPAMEDLLRAQTPLADMVSEALESALLFPPGTRVSYADYHYLIAAHMAELATGQPFTTLVQQLVLAPAALQATFFPPNPAEYARIAKIRGPLAEGTAGAMYNSAYALALGHPAFGVVATANDLARFALHFMPAGPRIHREATVQAMICDQTGGVPGSHPAMRGYSANGAVPWGLGWYIQRPSVPAVLADLASFSAYGHGGASGCVVVADPLNHLVVAIVSNTHVRTGAERWRMRLQSIANMAFALAA